MGFAMRQELSSGGRSVPMTVTLLCEGACNPDWRERKRLAPRHPDAMKGQKHTLHMVVSPSIYRCSCCGAIRRWG